MNTVRLFLQKSDIDSLTKAIEGNEPLSKKLGVTVPSDWTEFGIAPLQYCLNKLSTGDEDGWWSYFPIHRTDNTLIGNCGYKGKPNEEGEVEIGYEVAPAYRNKGYATEITMALVENAFRHQEVKTVSAHTLAAENPSTSVLKKCGFEKVAEINDPDDGAIWKWELKRK